MTDLADAISPSAAPAPAPSSWPSPNGSPALPPPTASQQAVTAAPVAPPPVTTELPAIPTPEPIMSPPAPPPATGAVSIQEQLDDLDAEPVDDAESSPAIVTGPAAILAPDEAIAPLDQSAVSLPAVAVAAPPAPAPSPSPVAGLLGADDLFPTTPPAKKKSRGGFGKFLLVIAMLGGLGYAGVTFGPDLYDEYVGEDEVAEQAAPLSFPRVRTTAPDVRTATFVLEGLATGSEADYTITVDFETLVSRVAIDRIDAPDLEVLTFSEDALVRRLDSPNWYQIERGSFPIDDQLQRADWIHMIDDLVPPERRAGVAIEESTVASIGGVDTRHLVISLDPALLGIGENAVETLDPMADIAFAAESANGPVPPNDAAETGDAAAVPTDVLGPEQAAIETVPVAGEALSPDAVRVELWIDGQGVVRRSVGTDIFGAESITILETSTDAWVPDYPDAAQVKPMTAAALIELGL